MTAIAGSTSGPTGRADAGAHRRARPSLLGARCACTWAWRPGSARPTAMLEEGHRRVERGTDLVVGFVETHGRPRTGDLLDGLEVVPRVRIEYRGVVVEEMDTEAIIARRSTVALIDELAHTNAPGSAAREALAGRRAHPRRRHRGHQHLQRAAPRVGRGCGGDHHRRARSTSVCPDAVLVGADEIELVDMSPHALRQRMRHGNVYPPERSQVALDRFFTEANLTALRELSLRFVAGRVDRQLERISTDMGVAGPGPLSERVMVLVDDQLASRRALRRGAAMASALRARLLALTVTNAKTERAPWDRARDLRENLDYAADLGADLVTVEADDLVAAVADQARRNRVSQVVMAHRDRSRMDRLLHRSFASALLEKAPDLEVHLVGPGGELRDPFAVGTERWPGTRRVARTTATPLLARTGEWSAVGVRPHPVADARLGCDEVVEAASRRQPLPACGGSGSRRRGRSGPHRGRPRPRPRAGCGRVSPVGRDGRAGQRGWRTRAASAARARPPTRTLWPSTSRVRLPLWTMPSASAAGPAARRSTERIAGVQLGHPERLGQVVVGATLQRLDLGCLFAARRKHDDAGGGFATDVTQHGQAVEVGQAQVQQHEVRLPVAPTPQGLLGVAGLDDPIAMADQVAGHLGAQRAVVLDQQDGRRRRRSLMRVRPAGGSRQATARARWLQRSPASTAGPGRTAA